MVNLNPFAAKPENTDDERIAKRAEGSSRSDRSNSDRSITGDREVTDRTRGAERRAMLRDTNTLLPAPPAVDGYHSFWATTTNTKDTVESRQRLGYTFITRDEAPNYEMSTLKSGEVTSDRIMINEMVAMKLPLDLWKEDMMDIHHTMPTEMAKGIKDNITKFKDGRGNDIAYTGGSFNAGLDEGFDSLGQAKPPSLKGVA